MPTHTPTRSYVPTVTYVFILTVVSLWPLPDAGDPLIPPAVGHLIGYAILAGLLVGYNGWSPVPGMLMAIAVGVGIELAQIPAPTRGFAFADIGMNTIGAIVGVTGVRSVSRLRERKWRKWGDCK